MIGRITYESRTPVGVDQLILVELTVQPNQFSGCCPHALLPWPAVGSVPVRLLGRCPSGRWVGARATRHCSCLVGAREKPVVVPCYCGWRVLCQFLGWCPRAREVGHNCLGPSWTRQGKTQTARHRHDKGRCEAKCGGETS